MMYPDVWEKVHWAAQRMVSIAIVLVAVVAEEGDAVAAASSKV